MVEGVPSEATACPTAAAQHLAPVTLDDPIDFYEAPEISGDAVISIVAAKDGVDFADLFTDYLTIADVGLVCLTKRASADPIS